LNDQLRNGISIALVQQYAVRRRQIKLDGLAFLRRRLVW
jgi:hypothetical protein